MAHQGIHPTDRDYIDARDRCHSGCGADPHSYERVILKGISAVMIFVTVLLLIFGLFYWTKTLIVLLIAGSMFWVPDFLAAAIFGLSAVQAKLMDLMDA